jgi:putative resolvase
MSARFVKPNEAEKIFGVHRRTLRKWADDGHIRSFRPGGTGQTLYDVSTAASIATPQPCGSPDGGGGPPQFDAIYARVSTRKQSGDLERQLGSLRVAHPDATVFSDIASGLNFKRKGLRALLKLAFEGKLRRVHVAHKDRLCRFAFDLVEYTLAQHGAVVVVDGDEAHGSDEQDLAQDVLSVITVFGARLHGKRSGQGRKRRREEREASEDGTSSGNGAGSSSDEAAGAMVRVAPPGPLH